MNVSKYFWIFLIALVFAGVVGAQGGTPSNTEIYNLTQKIKDRNPGYTNPNLVHVNDVLIVPLNGQEYRYTVESPDLGADCMWRVAEKALTDPHVLTPPAPPAAPPATVKPPVAAPPIQASAGYQIDWYRTGLWLGGILLGLVLLALILYGIMRLMDHLRNADRHPAVVEGGLPDAPLAVAQQISGQQYPGGTIRSITKGHIECTQPTLWQRIAKRLFDRKFTTLALMQFRGGVSRPVNITEGDVYWQVVYTDGRTVYYRQRCGNQLLAELPTGWSFTADEAVENIATNPAAWPPVLSTGLDADPTNAAQQIENLPENRQNRRRVFSCVRGILARNSGPETISVRMRTGGAGDQDLDLRPGDAVYRVTWEPTQENGEFEVEYYVAACGNGVVRGLVTLPEGWEFQMGASVLNPHGDEPSDTPEPPTDEPLIDEPPTDPPAETEEEPEVEEPTPPPAPIAPPAPLITRKCTVTISNGGAPIVISAEGTEADMPTKVDVHETAEGDRSYSIFFPKA